VNERERESEREGGRERERNESEIVCACCSVAVRTHAARELCVSCAVLPTAPAPRAVFRRCLHTPYCLSLSTPARPYLDDSGMPVLGCNVQAADAVLVDAHDQRHAALLVQHLHPCGPASVMCVRMSVCVCVEVSE